MHLLLPLLNRFGELWPATYGSLTFKRLAVDFMTCANHTLSTTAWSLKNSEIHLSFLSKTSESPLCQAGRASLRSESTNGEVRIRPQYPQSATVSLVMVQVALVPHETTAETKQPS